MRATIKVPNININCKASATDTSATPFSRIDEEYSYKTIRTTSFGVATALTSLLKLLYRIKIKNAVQNVPHSLLINI